MKAYQPHAWPADYRIAIDEEIVGIAATSNGVVVGTKGTPYLVTGTDPSSMVAIRIESGEACLSKRSMVDMGEYILYAGPDGIVAVQGATASVVTEALITPEQWQVATTLLLLLVLNGKVGM